MILNFPKFLKGKRVDKEPAQKDVVKINPATRNYVNYPNQKDMPSVTHGRVTIHFTSISPDGKGLLVGFFIANGYGHKVKFGKVPLVLLDSNRRVLAQQTFNGETIGEVAGDSTKACVVRFMPNHVFVKKTPSDCQLCFDVRSNRPKLKRPKNFKITYQALPDKITDQQKQELEQKLAELPPMKFGEANFSPLYAKVTAQNTLLATVIIRNATSKPVSFEQIPLAFIDGRQEVIARGNFDIKNITINPLKAVLWTFNFENPILSEDIDLSSWHIHVLQKQK